MKIADLGSFVKYKSTDNILPVKWHTVGYADEEIFIKNMN
jgi:hypothetical protein